MSSLKAIAEHCGKDVSTVSRALRDDPRVKKSTRDEIKAVATQMGYTPNLAARSLRLGATKTIWFFAAGTENPMVREAAESAARFLRDADYDLLLTLHSNEELVFQRLLSRIEQGVCDGAIIVPNGDMGVGELKKLADMEYPVAFLDRHLAACKIPVFTTDNYTATCDLLRQCIHESIDGVFPLFGGNTVEDERLRGAVDEAKKANLRVLDETTFINDMDQASVKNLAILGSSQATVCGFYAKHSEVLRSCNIVFGVFDGWIGEPFPARKTYICEQNFEAMARQAVDYLLRAIADHETSPFKIVTTAHKQIRSVAPSGE